MEQLKNKIKSVIKSLCKRGAVSVIIGNFATSFLTFFGSIIIVRVMTKSDFGVLSYMDNLFGFIYIFTGMGMKNTILRYVILEESSASKLCVYKYCNISGVISNAALIFIALVINLTYPHPEVYGNIQMVLGIYILVLIPQFITESNIVTYRSFLDNRKYAIYSIVLSVCMLTSKVLGYKLGGLLGIVVALILSYIIISVITSIDIRKSFFKDVMCIGKIIKRSKKKEMWSYSIQYMFTNGVWALFMLMDIYLIGKLTSDITAVADYKVAHVFPGAMTILSSTVGIFVIPYFVKNSDNISWIRKKYKLLSMVTMIGMASVIVFCCIIAKPLILIFYGEQYLNIVNLMRLLFVAAFFNAGIRYTNANVLAAIGDVSCNLGVSICGLLLQIIIDVVTIPKYGVYGVAISNIFTYFFMAGALFIYFYIKYIRNNRVN